MHHNSPNINEFQNRTVKDESDRHRQPWLAKCASCGMFPFIGAAAPFTSHSQTRQHMGFTVLRAAVPT